MRRGGRDAAARGARLVLRVPRCGCRAGEAVGGRSLVLLRPRNRAAAAARRVESDAVAGGRSDHCVTGVGRRRRAGRRARSDCELKWPRAAARALFSAHPDSPSEREQCTRRSLSAAESPEEAAQLRNHQRRRFHTGNVARPVSSRDGRRSNEPLNPLTEGTAATDPARSRGRLPRATAPAESESCGQGSAMLLGSARCCARSEVPAPRSPSRHRKRPGVDSNHRPAA